MVMRILQKANISVWYLPVTSRRVKMKIKAVKTIIL